MKMVITGGTGFIGTNLMMYLSKTQPQDEIVLFDLVAPCVELPPNVTYMYGNVCNLRSLLNAFEGADEVYNLAGILGTSELLSIASLASEVNIVGCANVMDACLASKVKRVYNVAKPHFEGYAENAYTLTKHAGELLGQMYRDRYGLSVATVRWLNAVGPYQHLYPVRKFVPTMILSALYDLPLEVYGSGVQTIDPIDVDDLSRFTVHAIRNLGGEGLPVVDLGSGVAWTCNESAILILNMVKEKLGSKSKIVHVRMREGEADDINLKADVSYWESVGMSTEISFEESISKTLDYILSMPEYHRRNALRFYGWDKDVR